ncbi:hypothetical protein MM326_13840 [Alkalihalobacillus sp. LMS6]|jgi:hypothetical protein|uniref:hypothetical protein n=1 Tax=Alkalihalobacillus sp. LMS6 TaxID=2924034 RepID=UPI0020D14BC4|nr:hypothetical protein [Alkalihalobacillus sp. LMS6]UTR05184.1 hypothetical protein MM326_13840 [Alkalihalobacillus sp. LMS6]
MKSIKRSKLVVSKNINTLNTILQDTIDEFNEEGLSVQIQEVYSESARRGGNNDWHSSIYDYILVVGYEI